MTSEKMLTKENAMNYIRDKDMRVNKDLSFFLNEKVKEILDESMKRAKKNNRTTVMPWDL